jgi:hypothetical protein
LVFEQPQVSLPQRVCDYSVVLQSFDAKFRIKRANIQQFSEVKIKSPGNNPSSACLQARYDAYYHRSSQATTFTIWCKGCQKWENVVFGLHRFLALALRLTYDDWKVIIEPHKHDLETLHLCHHSSCINPYHFESESTSKNINRNNCSMKVSGSKADASVPFEDLVSAAVRKCTHDPKCFPTLSRDKRKIKEVTEADWNGRRVHWMRCMDVSCMLLFERFLRTRFRKSGRNGRCRAVCDNCENRPNFMTAHMYRYLSEHIEFEHLGIRA